MTRRRYRWAPAWLVVGLLAGCGEPPADHKAAMYLFGTLVEVTLSGVRDDERARTITADLETSFRRMHHDWHAWKPGPLQRLNAALPSGQWTTIESDLATLIRASSGPAAASGDRFNPAIGRLVALWGFHSDALPVGSVPDARAIENLVAAAPRMADLELREGSIRSRNPAVQLDFGAFAKGFALNIARQRLRDLGVRHALLNAGGDLCVLGQGRTGPWRVGIRDPFGKGTAAALKLRDGECVMTSGNYERYREQDGIQWGHLIDPHSGYPVQHIASVTVVHPDGGLADAAATALSVATPDQVPAVMASLAVDQVLRIQADGTEFASAALAPRLLR